MNTSGLVVKALVDELALPPNDLLVIHDDLDLEPGRLRIKRQGGSGGHNGIHSIVSALGTTQFPRLKIGIGRPAPGVDAAEYVLSSFLPEETDLMDSSLQLAVEALETLLLDGIDVAMNRYNVRSRESEGESEGEAEEESDGA